METPTAPTVAPQTATPETQWERLSKTFMPPEEDAAEPETPETPEPPATEQPKPETSVSATPPTGTRAEAAEQDLSALDALIEADRKAAETPAEKPAVSSEQQQILSAIPNLEVARDLGTKAQTFMALDDAVRKGDYGAIEHVFAPQAWHGLLEDLYIKHIEKWVERYVEEKENGGTRRPDPELARLRTEWDEFQKEREAHRKAAETQAVEQSVAERNKAVHAHVDALLDAVQVTDPYEKRTLRGQLREFLAENPQAAAQVRHGKFAALSLEFRRIYPEFRARMKAKDARETAQREGQEKQKPIVLPSTPAPAGVAAAAEDTVVLGSEAHWLKKAKQLLGKT